MDDLKIKKMKTKKKYAVIKFIEKPNEETEDYVCVPSSWIYNPVSPTRCLVSYPYHENPETTRNRVKNYLVDQEINWRFYMSKIIRQFDTYKEAESWIFKRNNDQTSDDEKDLRGTQQRQDSDKTLQNKTKSKNVSRLNIRKPLPRLLMINKPHLAMKKRLELSNKTTNTIKQHLSQVSQETGDIPGNLNNKKSIAANDNESIESSAFDTEINSNPTLPYSETHKHSKVNQSVDVSVKYSTKFSDHKQTSLINDDNDILHSMTVRDTMLSPVQILKSGKPPNLTLSPTSTAFVLTDATKPKSNNESQLTDVLEDITLKTLYDDKYSSHVTSNLEKSKSMPVITNQQFDQTLNCNETHNLVQSLTSKGEIIAEAIYTNTENPKPCNETRTIDVLVNITSPMSSEGIQTSHTNVKKTNCVPFIRNHHEYQILNSNKTPKLIKFLDTNREISVETNSNDCEKTKLKDEIIPNGQPDNFFSLSPSDDKRRRLKIEVNDSVPNKIPKHILSSAINKDISIETITKNYSILQLNDEVDLSVRSSSATLLENPFVPNTFNTNCGKLPSVLVQHKSEEKFIFNETQSLHSEHKPFNEKTMVNSNQITPQNKDVQNEFTGIPNKNNDNNIILQHFQPNMANLKIPSKANIATKKQEYKQCVLPIGVRNSSHKTDNNRKRVCHNSTESSLFTSQIVTPKINPNSEPLALLKTKQPQFSNICKNPAKKPKLDSSPNNTRNTIKVNYPSELVMCSRLTNNLSETLPSLPSFSSYNSQALKHPHNQTTLQVNKNDNFVQQPCLFTEQSQRQLHIPIQQIEAHQQNINHMPPKSIQFLQNVVKNVGIDVLRQPNTNQKLSTSAPRNENQYLTVNGNYSDGLLRQHIRVPLRNHDHMSRFVAPNSSLNISSNSSHSLSLSQKRKSHLNYPDNCSLSIQNDLSFNSKHNSQIPRESVKNSQLFTLANNPSYINSNYQRNYRNPFSNEKPVSKTDVQVPHPETKSFEKSHDSLQDTSTKKPVTQTVKTESIMSVEHTKVDATKLVDGENQQIPFNSEVQNENYLIEKLQQPHKMLDSNRKANKVVSHKDFSADNVSFNVVTNADDIMVAHIPAEENIKIINSENDTLDENHISQSVTGRTVVEQKMLDLSGALFSEMASHLSTVLDLFNKFDDSTCKTNKILSNIANKFNILNSLEDDLNVASDISNIIDNQTMDEIGAKKIDKDDKPTKSDTCGDLKSNNKDHNTHNKTSEFDNFDSRWTLKYPEYKTGLTELIPFSHIYVKTVTLKNIEIKAKDVKMLVRMLLTEIFIKDALSICSWTRTHSANKKVIPGLDENAVDVLNTFVNDFAAKRGWESLNLKSFDSCIRSKLKQMREKWGANQTLLFKTIRN